MPRYTVAEIGRALEENHGLIYVAAKQLGCSRNTIKARLEQSAELRRILEEARGRIVDRAEQKLFEAIEAGDPWAITLLLKTVGKDRGYVERQQIAPTDPEGGALDLASLVLAADRPRTD